MGSRCGPRRANGSPMRLIDADRSHVLPQTCITLSTVDVPVSVEGSSHPPFAAPQRSWQVHEQTPITRSELLGTNTRGKAGFA